MGLIHKRKYIHTTIRMKTLCFFSFLSRKTKKREYLFYQKGYEKYYGKSCDRSYKSFSRTMLGKSILWWLILILYLISIISIIIDLFYFDKPWFPLPLYFFSRRSLSYEEVKPILDELENEWENEDKLKSAKKNKRKKEKRYIYEPTENKIGYFFVFFQKKTKQREYIFYQKCYEKYYRRPFDRSYKKFWRMMLRKSIFWWFILIFFPILIILFLSTFLDCSYSRMSTTDLCRERRTLTYEESKLIRDELEKQWAEDDKLEALQKESKEH